MLTQCIFGSIFTNVFMSHVLPLLLKIQSIMMLFLRSVWFCCLLHLKAEFRSRGWLVFLWTSQCFWRRVDCVCAPGLVWSCLSRVAVSPIPPLWPDGAQTPPSATRAQEVPGPQLPGIALAWLCGVLLGTSTVQYRHTVGVPLQISGASFPPRPVLARTSCLGSQL